MEYLPKKVYRISRGKYAKDISGVGASITGGRWNSKNRKVVYTASSVSLAMLEILVHVDFECMPEDFSLLTLEIPAIPFNKISPEEIDFSNLNNYDHTREIGDKWLIDNLSLYLSVPSIVNPKEYNYLINPSGSMFENVKIIKIEPFKFDPRLKKIK